jgi:hypothetical protein
VESPAVVSIIWVLVAPVCFCRPLIVSPAEEVANGPVLMSS